MPRPTFALGKASTSGRRPWWNHYGYESAIVPWLRKNASNYDVVVINGLWKYATMAARRALVGTGVPYVVFPHAGSMVPQDLSGKRLADAGILVVQ